jgi:thymidylate synthase (FAD)
MKVRLLARTEGVDGTEYKGQSLDEITVGIARLSSSREINTLFEEPEKLLRHCLLNGHWSVFTTTTLVFEIVTSRAIGRELLRHWSLRPQELSQRYAEIAEIETVELRKQAENNRQSSTEVINDLTLNNKVANHIDATFDLYDGLLEKGVSRETARMLLPETTQTKIIFNGTLREWITTLNQRLHKTAQKEIRLVAQAIRDEFIKQCPIISEALYNFEDAEDIHIMDRLVLEKFGVYEMVKQNGFKKLKK